jgi:hypothetical protein
LMHFLLCEKLNKCESLGNNKKLKFCAQKSINFMTA